MTPWPLQFTLLFLATLLICGAVFTGVCFKEVDVTDRWCAAACLAGPGIGTWGGAILAWIG